jgi:MFS family permease
MRDAMLLDNPALDQSRRKWATLVLLSLAELLSMAVWFSASSVVPSLSAVWDLSEAGRAWLTMSVQIGFVAGALISGLLNLADRLPAHWLFVVSSLLAGLVTALIPLAARGLSLAIVLRLLTGVFLAGVYPVGMKIMATWTKADRGLGIGLVVGALTVGSATPHLLKAFGGAGDYAGVLYLSAGLALTSGLLAAIFVREGPHRAPTPPFSWRALGTVAADRETVLANLGYLGHMWELYAMWTWLPLFLLASFQARGLNDVWASVVAFSAIAIGGLGSVAAGKLADAQGRTTVVTGSLVVSGGCALVVGHLFGGSPLLLSLLVLVWGFAVVADSAQFSACVSELCPPTHTGTALTLQTSLGFLLTLVTIRLVPSLVRQVGWGWAFSALALGPLVGVVAMGVLRRSPAALKLAGGRR